MEVNICLIMIYVGVFYIILCISSLIVMIAAFAIYKKSKGKLNFWQFAKRWKV